MCPTHTKVLFFFCLGLGQLFIGDLCFLLENYGDLQPTKKSRIALDFSLVNLTILKKESESDRTWVIKLPIFLGGGIKQG